MIHKYHTFLARWPRVLVGIISICLVWISWLQAAPPLTLVWDANSEPDIAGYRVHYGTVSGIYTESLDVGNATSAVISNLTVGTYFFAVTAYDTGSLESEPSNEVSATVTQLPPSAFGGAYSGAAIEGPTGTNVFLDMNVSRSGAFTGRVVIRNMAVSISGKLSTDGAATVQTLLADNTLCTLAVQLDPSTNTIAVHVTNGSTGLQMDLLAAPFSGKKQAAPQAGKYTVRFGPLTPTSGDEPLSSTPDSWGFALLTITKAGLVRVTGRLADTQSFAASSVLRADASFLLHSPVYRNPKGLLVGEIAVRDTPGVSDGDGLVCWLRPAKAGSGFFKEGFQGTVAAQLSLFDKSSLAQSLRFAPAEPAEALLSDGDLPLEASPIQRDVVFRQSTVAVLNPGKERLKLAIHTSNGLIGGSFVHPTDGKIHPIRGVLFQKQAVGAGFFAGIETVGKFELTGLPGPWSE